MLNAESNRKLSLWENAKLYLQQHYQALRTSLHQFQQTPLSSGMLCLVIAIALALPGSLLVLIKNAQQLSGSWQSSSQISVFLKPNVTDKQTKALLKNLSSQDSIANIQYISPQQGLTQLEQQLHLSHSLNLLKTNPLPGVILIQPRSTAAQDLQALVQQLQQLPQVDVAQLDMQWLQRLDAVLALARHIALSFGILLSGGILLIIGHTLHLHLEKYRQEIVVYQLIGATNGFIRRPFLYSGILYGLVGSVFAWLFMVFLVVSLKRPVQHLAALYNSTFILHMPTFKFTITLLSIGVLLGFCGAWLAVGRLQEKTNSTLVTDM
jgi:cell division transport system permease protein